MATNMWMRTSVEHYITHVVHEDYLDLLAQDLVSRGGKYTGAFSHHKFHLDLGGMCRMDRKIETLHIESLELSIPSEDLPIMYNGIKELKPRSFANGSIYYKIKTWPGLALVLNEEQYGYLKGWMKGKLVSCQAEVEAEKIRWQKSFDDGLGKYVVSERRDTKQNKNKA